MIVYITNQHNISEPIWPDTTEFANDRVDTNFTNFES